VFPIDHYSRLTIAAARDAAPDTSQPNSVTTEGRGFILILTGVAGAVVKAFASRAAFLGDQRLARSSAFILRSRGLEVRRQKPQSSRTRL